MKKDSLELYVTREGPRGARPRKMKWAEFEGRCRAVGLSRYRFAKLHGLTEEACRMWRRREELPAVPAWCGVVLALYVRDPSAIVALSAVLEGESAPPPEKIPVAKTDDAQEGITPEQCRAARALLGWGQAHLHRASLVSKSTILGFETASSAATQRTILTLRAAFEAAGVQFLPNNGLRLLS